MFDHDSRHRTLLHNYAVRNKSIFAPNFSRSHSRTARPKYATPYTVVWLTLNKLHLIVKEDNID